MKTAIEAYWQGEMTVYRRSLRLVSMGRLSTLGLLPATRRMSYRTRTRARYRTASRTPNPARAMASRSSCW